MWARWGGLATLGWVRLGWGSGGLRREGVKGREDGNGGMEERRTGIRQKSATQAVGVVGAEGSGGGWDIIVWYLDQLSGLRLVMEGVCDVIDWEGQLERKSGFRLPGWVRLRWVSIYDKTP